MNADTILQSLLDDPAEAATTWLVLADWLEEQGDVRAELVRLCHDPTYRPSLTGVKRDARVRALLAAGLVPCVPAWDNSIGMKLALLPAGAFLMGSPASEGVRNANEEQHAVEITRPFFVGIYPVTQEQFKKVMGKDLSHFTRARGGGPRHPVETVYWHDAVEFCGRLSQKRKEKQWGRKYRLPTEAEWEYACRAGATSSQPFHFGDSLSSAQANVDGNYPDRRGAKGHCFKRTTVVGSYQANAFGLYDLHGNVWEWCADWYATHASQPLKDPTGPATGAHWVLRGGAWDESGPNCRSAYRNPVDPGYRSPTIGFRGRVLRADLSRPDPAPGSQHTSRWLKQSRQPEKTQSLPGSERITFRRRTWSDSNPPPSPWLGRSRRLPGARQTRGDGQTQASNP